MDVTCGVCNTTTRHPVHEEFHDHKAEAEYWKERYLAFGSRLTELLRYSEMHYSINPAKDKFMQMP